MSPELQEVLSEVSVSEYSRIMNIWMRGTIGVSEARHFPCCRGKASVPVDRWELVAHQWELSLVNRVTEARLFAHWCPSQKAEGRAPMTMGWTDRYLLKVT